MPPADAANVRAYKLRMARKGAEDWPEGPYSEHDWYLREWIDHFGWSNVEFADKAGWAPSTVTDLTTGTTNYYRRRVIEAAQALGIAPFELMMKPEDAMALRKFRDAGSQLFGEHASTFRAMQPPEPAPQPKPKRGRPRKS